jgi:GTP pyrophosphokinase
VLRREEQTSAEKLGLEIFDRELKRRRLVRPVDDQFEAAARALGLTNVTQLFASIGQGDINATAVLKHLFPALDETEAPKPTAFERLVDRMRGTKGVRIQGVDGLMVRYAQCCQPVPGDSVVGYVTQGRGISIHRSDCPNLLVLSAEAERRVEIDWQESEGETFVVRLSVTGEDRRGLYADICEAISESGTNIRSAELATRDGAVFGTVLVEVENQNHLNKVIKAIRRLKGVTDVARHDAGAAA